MPGLSFKNTAILTDARLRLLIQLVLEVQRNQTISKPISALLAALGCLELIPIALTRLLSPNNARTHPIQYLKIVPSE